MECARHSCALRGSLLPRNTVLLGGNRIDAQLLSTMKQITVEDKTVELSPRQDP